MLSSGQRLGPYEIVGALGAGGMGEVYRARDSRLDRDVALKILPPDLAEDPDRLVRFAREAKTLAAVNHPNIATIFGVENGALVMELVEGEDLSAVLARGPLPAAEAVPIARDIASALETAHAAGIVHRDLKPSNIKVRPDGVVKVLDFGLAKAVDPAAPSALPSALANSPTVTTPGLTAMGVILGTAAYVSPEQAKGKPVDRRADVWAFGCVLFEMLAGRRAFAGDDVTDILASILRAEPDWAALPPDVPPALRRLLRHCLQKDPRHRLRDMGDVQIELSDAFNEPAATPVRGTPRWRAHAVWVAALLMVAAAGAAYGQRSSPRGATAPAIVTRFVLPMPEGQTLNAPGGGRHFAVSPDGNTLVFAAGHRLYRRSMSDPEPHAIIDAADADPIMPVFSPDGRFIAYRMLAGRGMLLKKVPTMGGTPQLLWEAVIPPATNLTYSDVDSTWLGDQIVSGGSTGIVGVSQDGGTHQTLLPFDTRAEVPSHVQRLSDGRHLLFTIRYPGRSGPDANEIVTQGVGGERKTLVKGGANGVVLPSGHLLYNAGADLVAVPFDEIRREVTGSPVILAANAGPRWAVSPTGTLVIESSGSTATATRRVVWVDRSGREDVAFEHEGPINNLRLSPDRTRAAFSLDADIWVWTFARKTLMRLTLSEGTSEYNPAWTPDGRRLLFDSAPANNGAKREIVSRTVDGAGSPEVVTPAPGGWPDAITRDGKSLLFHTFGTLPDLMLQPIKPSGTPRTMVRLGFNGDLSPDGRWLAYQSIDPGSRAVFVQPFPNVDAGRWQVSTAAASVPLWSHNGKELFFIDATGMLVSVSIASEHGFAAGPPKPLFRVTGYEQPNVTRNYDVSLDGTRFLLSKAPPATSTIVVASNWLEELKTQVKAR